MLEPKVFPDDRGSFHEWFRGAGFREATGQDLDLAQANCSVSNRGTLRGIHFADVPPSQAKYVTCVRGVASDCPVCPGRALPRKHGRARRSSPHRRRAKVIGRPAPVREGGYRFGTWMSLLLSVCGRSVNTLSRTRRWARSGRG